CETLDNLQQLSAISAIIGNIAGDKVVLCGCTPTKNAEDKIISRAPGWVFVRTKEYPNGEVLYWEGGDTTSMFLNLVDEKVTATDNRVYEKAYTHRSLAPGYGNENFKWEDFTDIMTIKEIIDDLNKKNKSLQDEIKTLQPPPLGIVQMWAGREDKIPTNYRLCNGQELSKDKYKELYDVIEDTFNTTPDINNNIKKPQDGFFKLPDLSGRFIVGYYNSTTDTTYNKVGKFGGNSKVKLTEEELPSHKHKLKDYYFSEQQKHFEKKPGYKGDLITTNGGIGSGDTDFNNNMLGYYEHDTDSTGSGKEFDIRPPYYVLAYIMRVE
ncbi:MAG: phage tail protein, partial [Muribaculaceae bacterium]|nr:phage tail protein [Muribaculaceae bacterium]